LGERFEGRGFYWARRRDGKPWPVPFGAPSYGDNALLGTTAYVGVPDDSRVSSGCLPAARSIFAGDTRTLFPSASDASVARDRRLLTTKRVAADHEVADHPLGTVRMTRSGLQGTRMPPQTTRSQAATMFTSLGGRTTTRLISWPARARVIPGAVRASSRSSASVMSGDTSSRSRTFPFT